MILFLNFFRLYKNNNNLKKHTRKWFNFCHEEETSDPTEYGGNQDVRYQEFNVTPDWFERNAVRGYNFFVEDAPEGALFHAENYCLADYMQPT